MCQSVCDCWGFEELPLRAAMSLSISLAEGSLMFLMSFVSKLWTTRRNTHSKDSISDTTLCFVHQSQENQTRHDPCHFAAFCRLAHFVYPEAPLGQCCKVFEPSTNLCLCLFSSSSFLLCFALSLSRVAGRPRFVAVAQSFALFTFQWNHRK